MSTSENIRHMRAVKNMTQEQLAMLMGVSRQSVAKWESGAAYPETEKLMRLAQTFECSVDELLSGDLTTRPVQGSVLPATEPSDLFGYDSAMWKFALNIASGVACIIGGVGLGLLVEHFVTGKIQDGLAALIFVMLGVAAGLALIIPSSLARRRFRQAHPFVEDFYTQEQKDGASKLAARGLVFGIALILAGVVACALLDGAVSDYLASAIMLLCIAAGVWLIVFVSLLWSRVNLDEYNLEVAEDMDEYEIDQVEDRVMREKLTQRKRKSRIVGPLCGIIMLVATIVGLILLFAGNNYFWLSWAVGGIGCGVASAVVELIVCRA